MAIEVINIGSAPNDGTGDSLRTSFTKSNNNFSYLNSVVSGNGIISANSLTVTGNVVLGQSLSFTPLNANLQYAGTANSYVQMIMQNKSSLTNASTDYVATADNGTDSSYFVDLGIASSTYYYSGYDSILPNDSYLIANGGNLLINAGSAGKAVKFVVGGSNTGNVVGQITNTAVAFTQTTISTSTVTGALQIAGGAGIAGNLNVGGYGSVSSGLIAAGNFAGTYGDGIILDYTTGTGRISVGASDGLSIYNSGLAGYALMTISNTGNVVATGTITTTANASLGNLTLTAANAIITGNNFSLSNVRAMSFSTSGYLGTNATVINSNLNLSTGRSISFYDINANVTLTFGGTIVSGIDKTYFVRNRSSSTANIFLPTAFNNKGSNVVLLGGNTVTSIRMVATDTTEANVFMIITNN